MALCVSKGASAKGATHTSVPFHNARFMRVTHKLHTERGALCDRARRVSLGPKTGSLATSEGGEMGVSLKPGGHSGLRCPVERKSRRAPWVTQGAAKLHTGWLEL